MIGGEKLKKKEKRKECGCGAQEMQKLAHTPVRSK